ncbi:MAG: DUF4091 domain-containing protein [Planctomycetaceae bacterium]|nr:DUF4091 domain-containing protein [Planctomycetaceae bacterium]
MYRSLLTVIVLLLTASFAAGADFRVSLYDGLQQFCVSKPPAPGKDSMTLTVSRNETVGFQAVVFNDSDSKMSGIEVAVENMPGVTAHVDAAAAIKVYRTRNMVSEDKYFDLLRPAGWEKVAPKSYQPYWIDFAVAKDAAPGVRNGKITFKHGGKTKSVSVQIKVSRSALPTTPTLPLAFAFQRSWIEQFYGRALTEEELFCGFDVMLAHRMGPVPMWSSSDYFFNEKTIRYCAERGMNVFLVSATGMNDAAIETSLRNHAPKMDLLRGLKLFDRTYQFAFDEILMQTDSEKRLPWMRATYEKFHEKYPEVKRLATSWPDKRLDDFTDIYVVPVGHYQPEMSEKGPVWWYSVGSAQINSSPDFRIDFPPLLQRYFFLANWRAGIDGHLYWAAHREWPFNKEIQNKERVEDEWVPSYAHGHTGARINDCGAGNLFYPGGKENVVLPSVRVKYLRDGVNDYEYLAQLRAATELLSKQRPAGWEKLLDDASNLMNFSPNLTAPPKEQLLNWYAQLIQSGSLLGINTDVFGAWKKSEHSDGGGNISLTVHPAAIREGGEAALRVLPGTDETFVFQDVPTQSGKEHSASVYIKTDDLKGKAWLRIAYLDAEKTVLQSADSDQHFSGSSGPKRFQKVEARLSKAPGKTAFLRISLVSCLEPGYGSNDKEPLAKAFFDDVSAAADNQPLSVINPGFEEKVRFNPSRSDDFFAFRNRLVDCLERICAALNESGPFANARAGRNR